MRDKNYEEFANQRLEMRKDQLRRSLTFVCACCQKQKPKGEAAGVHIYNPKDLQLKKAMLDQKTKMPKVATYVTCLECMDNLPEDAIHSKVTAYLGAKGLFEL